MKDTRKKKKKKDVSFDAKTGEGVSTGTPTRTGVPRLPSSVTSAGMLPVFECLIQVPVRLRRRVKQSTAATMSPFHMRDGTKWSYQAADREGRLISATSCVCMRGCVCVCYDFSCTLWPTCSMEWVSRSLCVRVCLRGRFASFYIWPQLCNPGYSICEANGEAFALECFCARAHGSQCVRIVSTSSPAVALLHLIKNCVCVFFFFFYLFPFPPVGDQKVAKGWGSDESWGWIWICDTYITAQRAWVCECSRPPPPPPHWLDDVMYCSNQIVGSLASFAVSLRNNSRPARSPGSGADGRDWFS